jgi:antirestriction protein ArdC
MKKNKPTQEQNQKSPVAPRPTGVAKSGQNEIDFVPSPDEVARKAYFSYVNQGSSQGHEVQHWLAAEAELIAERNLTRVHGYHNKS